MNRYEEITLKSEIMTVYSQINLDKEELNLSKFYENAARGYKIKAKKFTIEEAIEIEGVKKLATPLQEELQRVIDLYEDCNQKWLEFLFIGEQHLSDFYFNAMTGFKEKMAKVRELIRNEKETNKSQL